MGAVQGIAAYKFLEKIKGHVIHNGHMVGVPADRTAYMKHKLRDIEKQG